MENVETNETNKFRYFSDEISSREWENAGTRKQKSAIACKNVLRSIYLKIIMSKPILSCAIEIKREEKCKFNWSKFSGDLFLTYVQHEACDSTV